MSKETIRLHIGNISNKLAENPDNLTNRLAKFGDVQSPLELHTKPVNNHYFGFITLSIATGKYQNLLKSFNNVQFMGMKLTISKAKGDFKQQWEKDFARIDESIPKDRVQIERNKRIKEYSTSIHINPITRTAIAMNAPQGYSKSAHVFMNKPANTKQTAPSHTLIGSKSYGASTTASKFYNKYHALTSGGGELVRGRIRKTPRTKEKFKNQTLRILINGDLKLIKAHKTKLWGYEKNKTPNDLAWCYDNGSWRSGDDHVIERVEKCGINGTQAISYGADIDMEETHANTVTKGDDKSKSLAVLASMFQSYDFDKPTEFVENEDEDEDEVMVDAKGRKKFIRFDYEAEGTLEGSDTEAKYDNVDIDVIESYKSQIEKPQEEVYYDESDEGNELDFDELGKQYSTEKISNDYDEAHKDEEVDEVEALEEKEDVSDADSDMSIEVGRSSTVKGNDSSDDSSESSDSSSSDNESSDSDSSDSDSSSSSSESASEDSSEDSEESSSSDSSDSSEESPDVTQKSEQVTEPKQEAEESSEEEFIPTFGASKSSTNDTEALRSLFNSQTQGFSLQVENDDLDLTKDVDQEDQQQVLKQIKTQQKEQVIEPQEESNQFGLFWNHPESAFLQTQTQLSKLGYLNEKVVLPGDDEPTTIDPDHEDETPYEQWFWKMRGETTRECKRRRRDVLRVLKKKPKHVV